MKLSLQHVKFSELRMFICSQNILVCNTKSNAENLLPFVVNRHVSNVPDINNAVYHRLDDDGEIGLKILTDSLCDVLTVSNVSKFTHIKRIEDAGTRSNY